MHVCPFFRWYPRQNQLRTEGQQVSIFYNVKHEKPKTGKVLRCCQLIRRKQFVYWTVAFYADFLILQHFGMVTHGYISIIKLLGLCQSLHVPAVQ